MASTPKKRPKSSTNRNPNPSPNVSSASNSSVPLGFLKEPSPGLFPSKEDLLRLLGVIIIAVSVAMTCNYIVTILNRPPKPFCDSDQVSQDSLMLPDFCEPCPNYGQCSEGNLECLPGYKKLGRSCVEDGEINQTARKLSDLIELRVCEAYAGFLCNKIGTAWVEEAELWKELDEHKLTETYGLKNDFYTYTKQKAIESVESSLEMRSDIHGIKELKCPDWLVEKYKPVTCHIQLWVSKHALFLVPVSVLIAGLTTLCISLIRRVRRSRYLSTRAEQLYQQVCEILEENAIVGKSVTGESEPWVVASRLRDHLLLPRERKEPLLWKKVEELVQEDSRLDQYPKLVKGESKVVWEWQVEGSLSSSRERMKGAASNLRTSGGVHVSPLSQPGLPSS